MEHTKKQTSIEWLKKQLEQYGSSSNLTLDWSTLDELCEQAKEMNEQQIAQAWEDGNYNYFHSKNNGVDFEHGLEYYREKYGEQEIEKT